MERQALRSAQELIELCRGVAPHIERECMLVPPMHDFIDLVIGQLQPYLATSRDAAFSQAVLEGYRERFQSVYDAHVTAIGHEFKTLFSRPIQRVTANAAYLPSHRKEKVFCT